MKAECPTKRLGEVCQTGSGGTPIKARLEYYENGTIPWLLSGEVGQGEIHSATNFITPRGLEDSAAKIFPDGTVLVAMYGATAGQVGILRFAAATNQAVCGVLPNGRFIPEFIYYLLLARKDELVSQAVGNAQPNISQAKIRNTRIPIAPLSEQRRIVGVLDEAFGGIATAKANAEKNLQNARSFFESHRQSVFAAIHIGWIGKRLGDIADTQYGLSEPMNEEGRGFKIFRMGEVQDGRLIDTGNMKFADIDKTEFEKYKLRLGDVLFNRTNSFDLVGKTGIFELSGEYCFASYLVRLLVNRRVLLPEFLNYFMNSEIFQNSVKRKASRSINQANINARILSNEKVMFPESLEEQQLIVRTLNDLREETRRLESTYQRKLAALDELKKSLLHQAFSGEL